MNGISIIIPTYNRERHILEAVESVINQEYDGTLEVIISDDGSTDKTLNLLTQYGGKIKILRKPKDCESQGAAATRNRGIDFATQKFICFLDSDDFYLPGILKNLASELELDTNVDFVFCRMLELKTINNKRLFRPWTRNRIFKNDITNPGVSRPQIVHTNSFMFKREIFNKVGKFNEAYSNGEDIDLWLRISEKYQGKFKNYYGAVYNTQHGDNQLTDNSIKTVRDNLANVYKNGVRRYYELALKDNNRIFELKHTILHGQYSNSKAIYLVKYIILIARYPYAFLQRIPVFYFQLKEKKTNEKWGDLDQFVSKKQL